MLNVALLKPTSALAPEISALHHYLSQKPGFESRIVSEAKGSLDRSVDVLYRMVGFSPPWSDIGLREFHDYASLSTGSWPHWKNAVKRMLNKEPIARTFLNQYVRKGMGFTDSVPWAYRDMGVPETFLEGRRDFLGAPEAYDHDLVYVGTMADARDVGQLVGGAVGNGLRILLVGEPSVSLLETYGGNPLVQFTGRLDQSDVLLACRTAYAGASHVPSIYPFTFQTATKVLEYCAIGLPVFSNRTQWATDFSLLNGPGVSVVENWSQLTRDELVTRATVPSLHGVNTWFDVFEEAGIAQMIERALT